MIVSRNYTKQGHYYNGSVFSGEKPFLGINAGRSPYWGRSYMFINLCKGAKIRNNSTDSPADNNGYRDASLGYWALTTHGTDNPIETGDYVLKWTGTADVTWTGGTLTYDGPNEPSPENRRIYNVNYTTTTGNHFVEFRDTGGGGTCTDVALIRPGDEARYDAGNIVSSQFIADIQGSTHIRFTSQMNWSACSPRDYDEFLPYDHVSWFYDARRPPDIDRDSIMSPIVAAKVASEIGINLWYNSPHQATDACVTQIASDFATHFTTPNGKIYVELSNEVWNAGGNRDGLAWLRHWGSDGLGESSNAQQADFDPTTATATTSSPHGLTTGDGIKLFWTLEHETSGYTRGAWKSVIVDSATQFRIAQTTADALAGYDVFNPLSTDYPTKQPGTETTSLTFFYTTTTNANEWPPQPYSDLDLGYADRILDHWAIYEAAIGNTLLKTASSQMGNSRFKDMQTVQAFRESVDYCAIAPYWRIVDVGGGVSIPNWPNVTTAECTAFAMNESAARIGSVISGIIDDIGHSRLLTYECGNEFGGSGGDTQEGRDKNAEWDDSDDIKEFTEWLLPWYAQQGIRGMTYFESHGARSGGAMWGLRRYPGDATGKQWQGMQTYFDDGAVPLGTGT